MLGAGDGLEQTAPVLVELQRQRIRLPVDLQFPVRRLVDDVETEAAVVQPHQIATLRVDIGQQFGPVTKANGVIHWCSSFGLVFMYSDRTGTDP